jgi:membrane protein
MKSLNNLLRRLNSYQQKHHFSAFIFAVIKKYGDDGVGRDAALLTYYSFLSLFPLLLLLTTLTDLLIGKDPHLREEVVKGLTSYFPLLGAQLSDHVHRLRAGGLALFAGILFTFYGTRGVADSFRRAMKNIWLVPKSMQKTSSFPKYQIKSLLLIVIGGSGFVLASISAALASAAGHGIVFRIISLAINLFILFWLFRFLIGFTVPKQVPFKDTRLGAAIAAVGLVILQSLGGYVLAHELKRLDALYSYFAVALGLMFWIYLQTQFLYYSMEIAVVSSQKLWPRSLVSSQSTPADERMSAILR